ncbi:MAG: carbohydrate-binding domain-containing protein [Cyanobacteria bacterium J06598_4]
MSLAAGVQELRLDMKSSQFNLNYIDLVAAEPGANIDRTAPTAVLNTTVHTKNAQGVAPLEFSITYSDDQAVNAATIDANDLLVIAPDGSEAAVSLVAVDTAGNGTPRTATYAIAAPGGSWNGAEAGDYTISLKAGEVNDTNNNSAGAGVLGNLTLYVIGDDEEPANPGTGNPDTGNLGTAGETIRIEAEDYKAGANGVAYFDTSQDNLGNAYRNDPVDIQTTGDVDGEFNIGWIRAEEFLTYDINVAEAGTYDVVLRVATAEASTKSINVVVGGTTSTANFGFTGGWQTYQDVVVSGVTLEAGAQELRLDFMSSKLNLNYFELVPQNTVVVDDVTAPIANLDTNVLSQQLNSQTAANFTVTYSDDSAVDVATIGNKDIRVTAPDGTRFSATFVSVDTAGNGTPRTATYAIAAPNGTWEEADAGEYTIFIKQGQVADTKGNVLDAATLGSLTINVPDSSVTGDIIRIEAEDYKAGTNGVEYFDFDPDRNNGGAYRPTEAVDIEVAGDVDGGFNVGWIQDGEFLTYDVDVAAAGEYNIVLRVGANADNQAIEVVAGDQAYTANFNSTGGWQTYGDVIVGNVNLAAGTQEIRLNMKSSDFNLNYFELVPTTEFVDQTAPTATLNTLEMTKQPDTMTPANFTVTFTDNVGIDVSTIGDADVTVTAPDGTILDAKLTRVNNDTDGNPRSAIYYVDAPGGTWDAADSGNYTVNLNAGEVADTSGNAAGTAEVGSFSLNVSTPVDDGVIRINAGANVEGIDTNNKIWQPDTAFIGGQASTVNNAIANTGSDFIYQSQRSGNNFAYSIPVEDGNYSVTFHLAELDHNNAGARRFDVALEGEQVLDDYDIWQSTKNAFLEGTNTAKIVQVSDLVVARDGAIDLDFTSVIDNATIAGIEIAPIEGAQLLIQESNGNTVIAENGTSDTYQLLLNTQPTANVTVNLQPDGQSTVNQNTIVFTPQNWSVPQTVTINAVDDNAGESQHISTIGHTISSADGSYNGLNAPSLTANVVDNDNVEVKFDRKDAASPSLATVATWGPDGRLYVGSYTGNITAYTFDDNYNVISEQSIGAISGLSNNNITGIAFNPHDNDGGELKLYVSHNQFRANQESFDDHDFDENTEFSPYSGQVSVLSGANFNNLDPVVQNIGVSNHDHGVNGLLFDDNGDLLITVGSNTNVGIADDRIGGLPESPFTVAILKAEITKPDFNGNIQYELPDDWVAPAGFSGDFNPADSQGFGGDVDVVPGVDVSIYASGLRNSYDLVYATNGNIYATENGANSNFGDVSTSATTQEPFFDNPLDELNLIEEGGYYGQPNRNRGRDDDRQNRFYSPDDASNGEYTAPIAQFKSSTNGLAEYRSTAFGSQLRGNLLAQNLDPGSDAILYNVDLSDDGQQVISNTELKTDGGNGVPVGQGVDVLTGFGGAILSVDFFNGKLRVATPVDDNITTATAYEIDEWRAPASGGGTFTIGGINFSNLNDTTVTIGEETASLISVSDKRIFGTLPAFDAGEYAAEGLLDITVASGGEVSTITDAFQPLFA